jgi:hypothetical protein
MGRRNLIEAMNKHLCLILAVLCVAAALLVRTVGAAETPPGPAPQKVQDLLTLLRDPTVADWLTAEIKAKAAQEAAHPGPTFSSDWRRCCKAAVNASRQCETV